MSSTTPYSIALATSCMLQVFYYHNFDQVRINGSFVSFPIYNLHFVWAKVQLRVESTNYNGVGWYMNLTMESFLDAASYDAATASGSIKAEGKFNLLFPLYIFFLMQMQTCTTHKHTPMLQ